MHLDRIIILLSYVYLAFPVAIFAIGWLKWPYALVFVLILLFSLRQCVRDYDVYEKFTGFPGNIPFLSSFFFVVAFVVVLWVGFSGIGGFSFQNSDHELRNLMLHDLIDADWPVIYDFSYLQTDGTPAWFHGALVYYITFWMPSALIGKLWGWKAANLTLYLWTVAGVLLSQYLLFRYLKKLSLLPLVLFIFWSGMDSFPFIIQGELPLQGQHIEWWAKYFQYSSNTTTLYWVFNQTVTTWIIVFLIMNQRSSRNLLFTYSLCLPFAPFPFIGLAPFVLYKFCCNTENDKISKYRLKHLWTNIKQNLTFANFVGGTTVALTFGLYFISNQHNTGNSGFVGENQKVVLIWTLYALFCIFEFGIYALIVAEKYRRNPYFLIAVISLLLIPTYSAGTYNDFAMRVSIPALLVLMLFVIRYLREAENKRHQYILIFFLVIGAVTPINEIVRSVGNTILVPTEIVQDHKKTFTDPKNIGETTFFVTRQTERAFFFRYLAKKQ